MNKVETAQCSLQSGDQLMAVLAPPPAPPYVGFSDNDGLQRFRMRVMQLMATVITVLAAGWLCTLGAIPAILGLMTAKHILVAVLVMGLGVDRPRTGQL